MWRNRRSFILGRQKEKKATLSKNHRSLTSTPDRSQTKSWVIYCSASGSFSLGNGALGGVWSECGTPRPVYYSLIPGRTHTYTAHYALGPLKKEGGKKTSQRGKITSKLAHTRGWSWGQGTLTFPLPY